MKSAKDGKTYYILFLACILASIVCGGLILKGIIPEMFWFLSVFLIAFGSTLLNQRNYINAKNETDLRRQRRADRKNIDHHRYL